MERTCPRVHAAGPRIAGEAPWHGAGRVAGCSPYAPESASRVLELVQGPHDLDAGHGGHLDDGCTEAVRMDSERRLVKGRAPSRVIFSIGQRIKVTIDIKVTNRTSYFTGGKLRLFISYILATSPTN